MKSYLSWDLFLLAFFAVVIAYSFIIGKNQTLKVILGTYVAILCADGLGNIFAKYFVSSKAFLKFLAFFAVANEQQAIAVFKVIVLLVLVVIIAVKGLYHVETDEQGALSLRFMMVALLGVLSAGLMISTVLVFISGTSLIGGNVGTDLLASATGGAVSTGIAGSPIDKNILQEVYNSSRLIRIMLDYANFWFFLPGVAFVVMSMLEKKSA